MSDPAIGDEVVYNYEHWDNYAGTVVAIDEKFIRIQWKVSQAAVSYKLDWPERHQAKGRLTINRKSPAPNDWDDCLELV